MTDQEIRIAVAECCGWKTDSAGDYHNAKIYHSKFPTGYVRRFDLMTFGEGPDASNKWFDRWLDCTYIPNYPEDLNAMHEVECLIKVGQMESWIGWIQKLVWPQCGYSPFDMQFFMMRATARQRAEAFLRTLNKWKDQP